MSSPAHRPADEGSLGSPELSLAENADDRAARQEASGLDSGVATASAQGPSGGDAAADPSELEPDGSSAARSQETEQRVSTPPAPAVEPPRARAQAAQVSAAKEPTESAEPSDSMDRPLEASGVDGAQPTAGESRDVSPPETDSSVRETGGSDVNVLPAAPPVVAAAAENGTAAANADAEASSPPPSSEFEVTELEADPNEMTAAELGLELNGSESGGPHVWQGVKQPAAPGAPAGPATPRGSRPSFDAPWVDEVPDPVTPYEQRVSETIRVADLPPAEQLRGRVLANRYLAEEIVEQRASSISYRAYHLALDRSVMVRILPRGLACADDVCREVRRRAALASGLKHPNIGTTLDFGILTDGWPYLVTEHLQGRTLATLTTQEGKFVLRRVLHIGKQLAAGLAAAHDAGLVHGLLNPDNVFIVEPGSPAEVAVLLGFGVSSARGAAPGPPRSGVFGVPFYVSPEQASCRPLDARSDIYSLGIVLYELMTGSPPFSDGDFAGVLCQHLDDEAPAPSSRLRTAGALAKAMDAIVQRCLRKDPARRYQTAAELEEDLLRLEAAAARTKRRPMPEVQRPTTTIHSPPPKAEGNVGPEAKVIVHGDSEELTGAEPKSDPAAARESSPRLQPSSSTPAPPAVAPRLSEVRPAPGRPPRVSVDQATIKITAVDRARFVRPSGAVPVSRAGAEGARRSWVSGVFVALRRFFANASGGDESNRP